MTAHLSTETLTAYRGRRLPPDAFLAADRHVGACPACSAAVAAVAESPGLTRLLDDEASSGAGEDLHLAYEALEALVDGTADELDRESAEAHVEVCAACRSALTDLQQFRDSLTASSEAWRVPRPASAIEPLPQAVPGAERLPPDASGRTWRRYALPAAAAVLVLAFVLPRLARPPAVEPASPTATSPVGAPTPVLPAPATSTGAPAPMSPSSVVASPSSPRPTSVTATPSVSLTPASPGSGVVDEPLRSGLRETAGKTFRFVAGEWVDQAYDRRARLPEVRVTAAAEREAVVQREPALAPFSALGRRVLVVVDGTVYVFDIRD